MADGSFSKRFGFSGGPREISVREDAPEDFRYTMLDEAVKSGLGPYDLRRIVCGVLRKRPNPDNWTEYPNVWQEVEDLVYGADWYRVYDILEAIVNELGPPYRVTYRNTLNAFFVEGGIGWQIEGADVVSRGTEAFESSVHMAAEAFAEAGRSTAQREIAEALRDLSRRPDPDLTGAIHHGMGALECVARDVSGEDSATFGKTLERHPDLLPKPLNSALSQIWGYSSSYARHLSEKRTPSRDEAELVVGIAAVVATYLSRKNS